MRKALVSMILFALLAGPSLAGTITTFEDGRTEAVAELNAPDCRDTIIFKVPAECHIRKATMNVSALAPDNDHPGNPAAAQVWLNDTLLWQFNGTDFGALGLQDKFNKSTAEWISGFGLKGGSNETTVRVPKKAIFLSAATGITCSGQGEIEDFLNFSGAAAGDYLGCSVSGAGDVNKDGYEDIIVGAYGNDSGGKDAGRAYIHFGGQSMDRTADVVLGGTSPLGDFGYAVSGAGDVNKDGYDDIIVGEINAGDNHEGRAHIYLGGAVMDSTADLILNGSGVQGQLFGASVSDAGDVNNDGYGDVIVGDYLHNAGGMNAGQVYIFLGGSAMDGIPDVTLTGSGSYNYLGWSVSGAGDVNGDGYDDVLAGAPYCNWNGLSSGRAYLFLGGGQMDSAPDIIFNGSWSNDNLGCSVSGAGDVNRDGYDDVIVGVYGNETNGYAAGRANIYFGGKGMDGKPDVTILGKTAMDRLGESVSGAGDVNNDGYHDVIVGAGAFGSSPSIAGKAYVLYGGAVMDGDADVFLTGASGNDRFGCSVSGAGDVNRDGYDDVIVGAYLDDAGGADAGRAYVARSYPGLKDAGVSVGPITVWSLQGYSDGARRSRDFSAELGQLVRSSPFSVTDAYGNPFVDVTFRVSSRSGGAITLSGLEIRYSLDTMVWDFKNALTGYIASHRSEKDGGGNLSIPIKVVSGTPGRLGLNDLSIDIDVAPELVKPIPDVGLPEDSEDSELVDLHDYFRDDHSSKDQLAFNIANSTNDGFVKVGVVGNRYVTADALEGEENDNWTGVSEVVVEARDLEGLAKRSNRFKIIVRNENDAPAITSQPPVTAIGGQEYRYQMAAVDGDGDRIAYGLAKSPRNMTIDSFTGLIRWPRPAAGRYDVTATAGDRVITVAQDFRITVPNRPPRVANTTIPTAYVREPYVYDIPAVDDDGDSVVFTLLSTIGGMSVDMAGGRLTWTPLVIGKFDVSVRIQDASDYFTYDFKIDVVQGNRAPVITSTPMVSAFAGIPYDTQVNATDPDGDTVTFVLVEKPVGMTIEAKTGRISWTPAAPGNHPVKLKASDGKRGEATQEFVVRVLDYSRPKVELTKPGDGNTVRGRLAVAGKTVRGTLPVVGVQLCVDSGEWMDVSGNSTWKHTLDTTRLKDGKHTIGARAYDGVAYSEVVSLTLIVDNSGGKGFIPGFAGLVALPALFAAGALLVLRRKMK